MGKQDNTRLVVYTLQNCIYCNDLKGKLKQLGISYDETLIDDGSIRNAMLGDFIEDIYKTENYPITEIRDLKNDILLSIISKTDLEEQEGIYIFETTEQIINKLKEFYAL
jgi:glutaredoxin